MSCERWNEAILGRLYDEIEPDQDLALESHLEGCAVCRASLSELRRRPDDSWTGPRPLSQEPCFPRHAVAFQAEPLRPVCGGRLSM